MERLRDVVETTFSAGYDRALLLLPGGFYATRHVSVWTDGSTDWGECLIG